MPSVAKQVVALIGKEATVSLQGDLGAGKTTLVQLVLKQLGYKGKVKSPTYNIIEQYVLNDLEVYHLDLYRIADPDELEYLAIDEVFSKPCVRFIEWYENSAGFLPKADIIINIEHRENNRIVTINS